MSMTPTIGVCPGCEADVLVLASGIPALSLDDVRLEALASWTAEDGTVALPQQAKTCITESAIAGSRSTRFVRDLLRTASA